MGDIEMIKGGGLAWLLRREGGVVVDVVDHRGISSDLGVYRREEGGGTVNTSKQMQHRCMTGVTRRARGVLERCYTIPAKGDNIRKVFPELGIFRQMKPRGTVACLL